MKLDGQQLTAFAAVVELGSFDTESFSYETALLPGDRLAVSEGFGGTLIFDISYTAVVEQLRPQCPGITHYLCIGAHRIGKEKFAEFCSHLGVSYREQLKEMAVFANDAGDRAAAEFVVHGEYLKNDPGLPEAKGQR